MTNTKLQPYWNEKHTAYAILVGGWNGWTVMNDIPELAWDSRIVGYVMEKMKNPTWRDNFSSYYHKKILGEKNSEIEEFEAFLKSIGYNDIDLAGIENIEIVWIQAGEKWLIEDGGECQDKLVYYDDMNWISFE